MNFFLKKIKNFFLVFLEIYLQKGLQGGSLFTALADLIKQHQIPTSMVPVEKLNHLSKQGNHQGAVARISPVTFTPLDELGNN